MRRWIEVREPGLEVTPPIPEAGSAIPKDA
jgi:hypothetical protein